MKLKPVFEAIAKDYPDIKFVKVNVEQYLSKIY
jgi:thiol-disulfide isomerase/thioredoxin